MRKFNQSYVNLLRVLTHYDVISFDIFDTAIYRAVTNPEDVFIILGKEYFLPNFRQLRVNAEKNAREKYLKQRNSREVTIKEIYTEFQKASRINIDQAIYLELAYEKKICYANPYIKYIYDCLQEQNKTVIFTSNMYLNKELMKELLSSCGYSRGEVYVSCDYFANKRNGKLFEYVLKDFQGKKIIHIGDDYDADVIGPESIGIKGFNYEKSTKQNKKIKIGEASYLGTSIYNAVVNNYLNNRFTCETSDKMHTVYKHGFKYGGPFILGYVQYIHEFCKKNEIDKICFLARDGDFLQKIYNYIYKETAIPNEYLLWSRKVALNTMPELYLEDIFDSTIIRRLRAGIEIQYSEACERLGIKKESLRKNYRLNSSNIEAFKLYFLSRVEDLVEKSNKLKENTTKYLKEIFKSAKHVALVDIGWRASGALSIAKIAKEEKLDIKFKAIVAGNYAYKPSYDAVFDKTKFINSFLFSDSFNREIALDFQKDIEKIIPLVEIFCASSESPSFNGISEDKQRNVIYNFDVPEVENYSLIKRIHDGEYDFIKEYINRTKNIQSEAELRGNDVYWFLKNGLNNETLRKDFQNYTYPRFITDTTDIIKIDNLGDFWK